MKGGKFKSSFARRVRSPSVPVPSVPVPSVPTFGVDKVKGSKYNPVFKRKTEARTKIDDSQMRDATSKETLDALENIIQTYNSNPATKNIDEFSQLIPDRTNLDAVDRGVEMTGKLIGSLAGDVAAKFVRFMIMKYVDLFTGAVGTIVPPEVKIETTKSIMDLSDDQLLLGLNTLITRQLNLRNPDIISSHLRDNPKDIVYYPALMYKKFPWKTEGVDGLGDDDFPWTHEPSLTKKGSIKGGRKTQRGKTQRGNKNKK